MCRSFTPRQSDAAASSPRPSDRDINSSSKDELLARHLALLLDVVRSRRWSAFDKIALSKPSVFRVIYDAIVARDVEGGREGTTTTTTTTLLHACLRCDPPFAIVCKMVSMLPDRREALRAKDGRGRTPLHLAAACVADPMVTKLLGSADPTACEIADDDGRTPLHLACTASPLRDEGEKLTSPPRTTRDAPSYDVVRALLSESLAPSLVEDEDGMSALELAIMSDASIEIVSLLQKASMELLRERELIREREEEEERVRRHAMKKRPSPDGGGDDDDASTARVRRRRVAF